MKKLIVIAPTVFKQAPKDSTQLGSGETVAIEPGQAFPIVAWQNAVKNHYKITLGTDNGTQIELDGKNTWFVFAPHVQFSPSVAAAESVREPFNSRQGIDWRNPNCKISRYFTAREVTNGDARRIPTDAAVVANILELAAELDKLREAWGSPIGVTSWYRPPRVNAAVGGVPNSQHINGGAADVYAMSGNERQFEEWLDSRWDRALGYGVASGRGFTHLDLRPGRIRWWY